MKITAKDIARELNISPAAVSIALNGKKGVSELTRESIFNKAKELGFNFEKLRASQKEKQKVLFLIYSKHGAIVSDTPFFSTLTEGISSRCKERNINLEIHYLFEDEKIDYDLNAILDNSVTGIILLATEMKASDFSLFKRITIPLIVLDNYFEEIDNDYCLINNVQGAYMATNFIIKKKKQKPGYLQSSYQIGNFSEREEGFYKALRENGFSTKSTIVHKLAPSTEGAYTDMKNILERKEPIATCYFADNDLIAAGAIKALKEYGYAIPGDVGVVGFDNTVLCEMIDPPLTTINVPKVMMGKAAVDRLCQMMGPNASTHMKIEMMSTLVIRKSL